MQLAADLDNAWVAVQTRSRCEKTVAERLAFHGYECYLPLQRKNLCSAALASLVSKYAERLPSIPLFPGYLFCRYKTQHNFRILYAPGVIRIVRYNNIPAVIPDVEIESIQRVVISGLSMEPQQFLRAGQKVRINSGPLKGMEGYLVAVLRKNTFRIEVGVSVVEKSIVIDVTNSDVVAIQQ